MKKIRVPNVLMTDATLSFSARRLGAYFCAVSNRLGLVRKSLVMLAGLSGLSVATVRTSIDELDRAGYLTRQRTYRYDVLRRRPVYDRTIYQVHKYAPGGFTLIPTDFLFRRCRGLSNSAFVLALYLFQQGAGQGRAFPSLGSMVEAIGVARSTVCRALQQLKAVSLFVVRHCIRRNHSFAANSYFFPRTACQTVPAPGLSSLKFYTPRPPQVNAVLV